MRHRRLVALCGVAALLGTARWLWPPKSDVSPAPVVVAAVDRRSTDVAPGPARREVAPISAAVDVDVPGNAFSVRVAPTPPPPPSPPAPPKEKPFMGPPAPPPYVAPPPPPPPPLQVVGTWDDGQSPGVFMASPQGGTVLARVGMVLLNDYTVMALTTQHVVLSHTHTKHEWRLPIPRAGRQP